MNNVKMCPKCGGEMVRGTSENLVRNFSCTRGEPKPEDVQIVKVHSSYCGSCGYMEFYRALVAEENKTLLLLKTQMKHQSCIGRKRRKRL